MRPRDKSRKSRQPSAGRGPTLGSQAGPALVPRWVWLALLAVAIAAAYANTFRVPFLFDDVESIVSNVSIRSLQTGLFPPGNSGDTVSGRPVLNLTLAVNWALGGEDVRGFHAVNLGIHVVAVLLLAGVVRRVLELPLVRPGVAVDPSMAALVVAALWGLHPLQTESVTYIVQRAESLAGSFYLATVYGFLRALVAQGMGWRRVWLGMSVVSCLLGMGTKEIVYSAPLMVLLIDRTLVSGTLRAAWAVRRTYYLMLAATWLLLAVGVVSSGSRGGSVGFVGAIGWWPYLLTQCHAVVHYLQLTLWPDPLLFDYGRITHVDSWKVLPGAVLMLATATWAVVGTWRRHASGLLALIVVLLLAPTTSFLPVETQTMAEHRLYLALAPLALGVTLLTARRWGPTVLGAWTCVAVSLGVATFSRNADYATYESIWSDTVAKNPGNGRAWYSLGSVRLAAGNDRGAIEAFDHALRIDEDDPETLAALGRALARSGQRDRAIDYLGRALAKFPEDWPTAVDARHQRGVLLVSAGQLEKAINDLRIVLRLRPDAVGVANTLADALMRAGRPEEAIGVLRELLARLPVAHDARDTLGVALARTGRVPEAIREFETVLRDMPTRGDTRFRLAITLMLAGQPAAACQHFETLDAQGRADGATLTSHAEALRALGQNDRAQELMDRARALAPASP